MEVRPADHTVSEYEFDVIIGADGRRSTLDGKQIFTVYIKLKITFSISPYIVSKWLGFKMEEFFCSHKSIEVNYTLQYVCILTYPLVNEGTLFAMKLSYLLNKHILLRNQY